MEKSRSDALISVIVPVYKVEAYLEKCADAILGQTYSNIEVILVDDGSPDRCGEICDRIALQDNRVVVIHKENGGLSSARNAGLDVYRGDYVAFVDSDDFLDCEYIEYMYELILKYDADIAACDYDYLSEEGGYLRSGLNDGREWVLDKKQALYLFCSGELFDRSAWGKLYARTCMEGVRFPEKRIYEDIPTVYKSIKRVDRVAYGRKTLYYYMYRVNAISKGKFSNAQMDAVEFTDYVCEDLTRIYPEFQGICSRMRFMQYCYTFKQAVNGEMVWTDTAKALLAKIKEVRSEARRENLSKKMFVYYAGSYLGYVGLKLFSQMETTISRRRLVRKGW